MQANHLSSQIVDFDGYPDTACCAPLGFDSKTGTCQAASGDAALEGGADGAPDVVPAGCELSLSPKDAPKCVVSEVGIFVDGAGGDDGHAGTKESPVRSLGVALEKLGDKRRVYVCEGRYDEHVKVTRAVSLYGGFACGGWGYAGTKSAVAPTSPGYALEISGASGALIVEDLAMTSPEATDAGASSVGVFVSRSSKVTFRRVTVSAGKGAAGSDAVDALDFAPTHAPDGTAGGAGGAATANPACMPSLGGAGGKAGPPNGAPGEVGVVPVFPTVPLSNGAGGSSVALDCGAGSSGRNGSYGIAGTPGVGAASVGALDASGWKASEGSAGGGGGHAQGGGGGAQIITGGVGGSGGPGGCGGAGGGKGTGGGSSIALLVFESSVALEQSTLTAQDAGRGGKAAKGGKAQLASTANSAPNSGATACAGGIGGVGGSGGGGGGGAGGVSVGVLYKGTAPSLDGVSTQGADTLPTVTLGAQGAAGGAGAGGDAAQAAPPSRAGREGTAGAEGARKAVLSAP